MKNKSSLAPKKMKPVKIVDGVQVSSTHCGLKKNKKDDLVLIKLKKPGEILGCFTKSKTPGEPILWNKKIIKKNKVSAILINSGNANVFNGDAGKKSVTKITNYLSLQLKIPKDEIYLASTGVIGEPLNDSKIIKKIPFLIQNLGNNVKLWEKAANAIRTTDTFSKFHSETFSNEKFLFINGIAKGSGMVHPNMATMLSFIFTNYDFKSSNLINDFRRIVDKTFNSISIDSDTSTSDMVLLFSIKGEKSFKNKNQLKLTFLEKLEKVMLELAQLIVKDGEGASKFIEVEVKSAKNNNDAKSVAKSIINSPLIKTAMAGSDSNWGRIVMAIGKSYAKIVPEKISIKFGNYLILSKGKKIVVKNLAEINKYLTKKEIKILVDLGIGSGKTKMWTCDFTKEYISINSDYRS